ncbi:MAG: hypothetical protein ACFB21_04240, partial [Opitutales bacterium]
NFDGRKHAELKFSQNQSLEHQVGPIEIQRLRKGGPQNGYEEEAIVHQGRLFARSQTNFLRTIFSQR